MVPPRSTLQPCAGEHAASDRATRFRLLDDHEVRVSPALEAYDHIAHRRQRDPRRASQVKSFVTLVAGSVSATLLGDFGRWRRPSIVLPAGCSEAVPCKKEIEPIGSPSEFQLDMAFPWTESMLV